MTERQIRRMVALEVLAGKFDALKILADWVEEHGTSEGRSPEFTANALRLPGNPQYTTPHVCWRVGIENTVWDIWVGPGPMMPEGGDVFLSSRS